MSPTEAPATPAPVAKLEDDPARCGPPATVTDRQDAALNPASEREAAYTLPERDPFLSVLILVQSLLTHILIRNK